MQNNLIVVAHDIRSAHNIGSLLRTAEGLGVQMVYLSGYTPFPKKKNDARLPHVAEKTHKQIQKTALGAEISQNWEKVDDVRLLFKKLKKDGYTIAALEQSSASVPINAYEVPNNLAILIGNEVKGVDSDLLENCDAVIEIPMFGDKESFNVVQATAMALFYCRFYK